MIFDGIPALKVFSSRSRSLSTEVVNRLIETLESTLGVRVIYEAGRFPLGDHTLVDARMTADALMRAGILKSYRLDVRLSDEPPHSVWRGVSVSEHVQHVAGASLSNSSEALKAMLSEALERFLWREQTDYFQEPRYATTEEIALSGPYIAPERFVSYSAAQRLDQSERTLRPDATYLWVRGTSLVSKKKVYVPAQVVSGAPFATCDGTPEPQIRDRNTNGLSAWPTQSGAQLAGILELIERDAYAIMWLNQLTPHRISLDALRGRELESIVDRCERYGLIVHALKMPTDAPTHAVCVILEDTRGSAPRYAFGLRAHRSLGRAIEKALTEALRARTAVRLRINTGDSWDTKTPILDIGHRDRLMYWAHGDNAARLAFLTKGPFYEGGVAVWESDTEEAHLARLISWCRAEQYECVTVPLTASEKNPTSLRVEMILMPDLQPMYLHEKRRHFGGKRLRDVPSKLGFVARALPFSEAPHPFS